MKKYLKMADVFPEAIKRGNELVCGHTLIAKFVDGDECECAAHAINSHDELVQMNQELMNALDDLLQNSSSPYSGDDAVDADFDRRYRAACDSAMAAIAKTKGGEA